jgi:signal transduction histidine kinase
MLNLTSNPKPQHLQSLIRRSRLAVYRLARVLPLSQRFLLAAVIVVALAMIVLGNWIGYYLQTSITRGVAASAAASIDSLIAHALEGVSATRPLTAADGAKLDDVFEVGNDADSTRLLQIRILNLDGSVLYESLGGLIDQDQTEDLFAAARDGAVVSSIVNLPLEPIGPIAGHSIAILKIYTPLHRPLTEEIFAVAALYYSAKSLQAIQFRAQLDVWVLVGLIGLGVIGVLYVLVDRASRTIANQRARLATNLTASRRLSEENRALHDASEQLRLNANFTNESLLAQVGSDIHDGPIQLLTLIILRLTKAAGVAAKPKGQTPPDLAATIQLATDAMEELRNISAGLVLPELATLSVKQAILLAISRHEEATGSVVKRELHELPDNTSMAVKICAYRIVQEALNNAFRHAGASRQLVTATASESSLFVSIANSAHGKRHHPATEDHTLKLGLRGMRFRVESLGGVLRADIGSSAMTTISAEIPYGVAAS